MLFDTAYDMFCRKEFGVEEDKSLPYLPDVFAAGITKAKAVSAKAWGLYHFCQVTPFPLWLLQDKKADDDIEASPKFQKFLASVQEKGYFKGAEVGTAGGHLLDAIHCHCRICIAHTSLHRVPQAL